MSWIEATFAIVAVLGFFGLAAWNWGRQGRR